MNSSIEPCATDVLLGRSKRCFNHAGNIYFRTLINENVYLYMDANTRHEKRVVIKLVFDTIISRGCRFLKQYGNAWVDISDNPLSRDKVSHAVRDAVTTHSKKGIIKSLWKSEQQRPFVSKTKITHGVEATKGLQSTTKLVFLSLDDANTEGVNQDFHQQPMKDERKCHHFHTNNTIAMPCRIPYSMDQCNISLLSLFSESITNGIDMSPSSFQDVDYDSMDVTTDQLTSSVLEETLLRGQEDSASLQSMYNVMQDAFDVCLDGEDHHMEDFEMWDDNVAKPLRSLKIFEGTSDSFSQEDEFGAFMFHI
jgi:hypothetical protein